MQIIPVIDLKGGQVVHAVRGDRDRYQPIHHHSRLTAGSDPDTVLATFLTLYPFETFYIADLDAITGNGKHDTLIDGLLKRYPDIDFWIDNGSQLSNLDSEVRRNNYRTVLGTESQHALPTHVGQNFILSLDFKQQQPAGDPAWFTDSTLWPEDVIIMTLNRVGSDSGPDFEKLAELSISHPNTRLVAAGGIRDYDDLDRLSDMGISAALIATSLHAGTLSGSEIADLRTKKYPGKPGYF